MKIYTYVKINIDTGKIVDEASYEYNGPIAKCDPGGGGGGGGPSGGPGGPSMGPPGAPGGIGFGFGSSPAPGGVSTPSPGQSFGGVPGVAPGYGPMPTPSPLPDIPAPPTIEPLYGGSDPWGMAKKAAWHSGLAGMLNPGLAIPGFLGSMAIQSAQTPDPNASPAGSEVSLAGPGGTGGPMGGPVEIPLPSPGINKSIPQTIPSPAASKPPPISYYNRITGQPLTYDELMQMIYQ